MSEQISNRNNNSELLFEAPLVADTDADSELHVASAEVEALSDDEIAGSRVRLLRKTVERSDDEAATAILFTTEFHPAPAARFTHASIVLDFISPENSKLISVAPSEVRANEPITFEVTRSGKISIEKVAKAELGKSTKVSYSVYPCMVRGSGVASHLARWTLEEQSPGNDGIGQSQDLALTLAGEGPFIAEVTVSARLLKPGIRGMVQRVRELILGPELDISPQKTVAFALPPHQGRSGFFSFWD